MYGKKIHQTSNPYSKLQKTEHPADLNYDRELELIKEQLESERARQRQIEERYMSQISSLSAQLKNLSASREVKRIKMKEDASAIEDEIEKELSIEDP